MSFVDEPPGPGIYCTLETYDLARCPPYVVLSYDWGSSKPRRNILVNHRPRSVRDNLYAALEVLQTEGSRFSEDPSREMTLIGQYFWVDSLCVNHDDPLERGHQVDLMANIFSEATCAVTWLGAAAEDSDYAMKAISEGISPSWDLYRLAEALHSLLDRPYWRRMWTVPEFILPENLLLLCGRRGSWYRRLSASLEVIRGLLLPYRTKHSQVDLDLTILCDSREQWHRPAGASSESFTLDSLVSHFFKATCNDVRDRVYALLPLTTAAATATTASSSEDTTAPPLRADYTIDEERLYYRVLGRMRRAPTLAQADQWRRFRFTLSVALRLARHRSSFLIREALYSLAEPRRAAARDRDLDVDTGYLDHDHDHDHDHDDDGPCRRPRLDERHAAYFLIDLAEHLQRPVGSFQSRPAVPGRKGRGGGGAPGATAARGLVVEQARKAGEVVEHFRFFPRDEDPGSWRDFEGLVREALALADRALAGVPFEEWSPDAGKWGFEEEREQERRAYTLVDIYQRPVM